MFFYDYYSIVIMLPLFLISLITSSNQWFLAIGIPILGVTFGLLEMAVFLSKKFPSSLLTGTLYFFVMTAGICVTIEAVLDYYFRQAISLSWSAIVLTVCAIIVVFLIFYNRIFAVTFDESFAKATGTKEKLML